MPASRRARAMIFAPRSCPSRPGLATTTRMRRPEVDMPAAYPLDVDLLAAFRAAARALSRGEPPGVAIAGALGWREDPEGNVAVGPLRFRAPEPDAATRAALDDLGTMIALEGYEARRRALLDVAFDSVITMDEHGRVLEAN